MTKWSLVLVMAASMMTVTCVTPALAGDAGKPRKPGETKMTVFPRVTKGQILMKATMPRLEYPGFLCAIMRSNVGGKFVGHFEAPGQAPLKFEADVSDLYECIPTAYPPGVEIHLVSDVNLEGPIGVSGQVQTIH